MDSPPLRHKTSSLHVYTYFIQDLQKLKRMTKEENFNSVMNKIAEFYGCIIFCNLLHEYCRAMR